jgi:hypothetical protein
MRRTDQHGAEKSSARPTEGQLTTTPSRYSVTGKARTGIEPVEGLFRALEPMIRLYAEHFGGRTGGG